MEEGKRAGFWTAEGEFRVDAGRQLSLDLPYRGIWGYVQDALRY